LRYAVKGSGLNEHNALDKLLSEDGWIFMFTMQ
jgi:hypothetical protein